MKYDIMVLAAITVLGITGFAFAQGGGTCWITQASASKCGTDDKGPTLVCCEGEDEGWEWVVTAQPIRNCQEVSYNETGAQGCYSEGDEVHPMRQNYKCGGLDGCTVVKDGNEFPIDPGCDSAGLYGEDCPDPSSGGGGV